MMADLGIARTRRALITAAAVLVLVFLADIPRPGHRRPTGTGFALEVVMSFGTLVLVGLAVFTVIVYAVRPTEDRALVYSWLALGVLVGDISLLMLGYWTRSLDERWLHYELAPMLLVGTAIAIGPALLASALRAIRRRA